MLYGIPPLRMVHLAKDAALNFPKNVKDSLAIMAMGRDVDDPVYRSNEQ